MALARRRGLASLAEFESRASSYWTFDRVQSLSKFPLPLSPDKPGVPALLRVLGLMNGDATINARDMKKYRQINSMLEAAERTIERETAASSASGLVAAASPAAAPPLRLVDLGTGASSHMALLLAFASRHLWQRPAHILAVDASEKRIESARYRAQMLGFGPDTLQYHASLIRDLPSWSELYTSAFASAAGGGDARAISSGLGSSSSSSGGRRRPAAASAAPPPHGVFALHACDTATDEAAAFAIGARAHALLLAPCCQAELAAAWKQAQHHEAAGNNDEDELWWGDDVEEDPRAHPFASVHRLPTIRTEMGATVTDTLRVLLLKASGYSTTVSDFVATEHTPKNRLLTAIRQRPEPSTGKLPKSAQAARAYGLSEYRKLRDATGGHGIALARMLGVET